jgi:hypothetical protein
VRGASQRFSFQGLCASRAATRQQETLSITEPQPSLTLTESAKEGRAAPRFRGWKIRAP